MNKLIIKIHTDSDKKDPLTDEDAIGAVLSVIQQGKISKTSRGNQYCFHTITMTDVHVSVEKLRSGTEVFNVYVKHL